MKKTKFIMKAKRLLSGFVATAIAASMLPTLPAMAKETTDIYPYTLFAGSSEEGAIAVNAGNFCVNGNVATNGTIVSSGNMNINGTKTENANKSMIFIFDKIDSKYFSTNNVEEFTEDYTLEEINININTPTEVMGETTLTGNININTALKSLEDVNLYGEVKNTNDSVIFSKYGDIIIDSQNVNLNGLVYAPFGDVEVTAQNLNLNNVVIIADTITLNCPNVNANYSGNAAEFVGTVSEPLDIPVDEWQYMKDENENDLPDFFEDMDNWELLKDTDSDKLPDSIEQYLGSDSTLVDTDGDLLDDYYEVFITGTDPTLIDTDENEITDANEDFDEDGLTNYEEYTQTTSPWSDDSDLDGLNDGEEVNTYGTNPLEPDTDFDGLEDSDEIYLGTDPTLPDTDGDGIFDCDEKFNQTFTHIVENEDCAIKEVIVSMEGTGNLQTNTTIESVMDKDVLCSEVVGLIGEPFSIETTSQFDTATLTFKIDQSKLGDTAFDNLMFLWYDEENYQFVELETFYDYENSTVSIETTHFSRYMVVDKSLWFEAWSVEFNYRPTDDGYSYNYTCDTVIAIDCSGSMSSYDITGTNSKRAQAATNFFATMRDGDRAGVVTFTSSATVTCDLTDSQTNLTNSLSRISSNGGTSFSAALSTALTVFDTNDTLPIKKRIILLSDGEDSVPYAVLDKCKERNIVVYTIGLGSSSDSVLETIATYTGGEFFKAYTADELVEIYSDIGLTSDFDTTDTDGDGLYDAVEAAGIRLHNGDIINTDPTDPDSDNDGLLDGEEINPTPIYSEKEDNGWLGLKKLLGINKVQGYYFKMHSNPLDVDYDYDGIEDKNDYNPMNNKFYGKMHYELSEEPYSSDIEFSVNYKLFFDNNTTYNNDIATTASIFASDIYEDSYIVVNGGANFTTEYNATVLASSFGLSDVENIKIDPDDYEYDKDDISELIIGHRLVSFEGEKKQIIIVSIRGTNGTNEEWSSNFDVGADTNEYYEATGYEHPDWKTKANHKGFDVTANRIIDKINDYLDRYELNDTSEKSILITGHSRGAAIANIVGVYFEDNTAFESYTYTFASPNTTTSSHAKDYKTIFNIINKDDLITYLPLGESYDLISEDNWGFVKYGIIKPISVEDSYENKWGRRQKGTWEHLVGTDYNNDSGTKNTLEAFSKIANCREELYIIDTSSDGKVNQTNIYYDEYEYAEWEIQMLEYNLTRYKLNKFCNTSIQKDWMGKYYVEVNYCPAYLMQNLANMTTGDGPILGYDVKGKYAEAKRCFVLSSGKAVLGGMEHPHTPITYYLIVHNNFVKSV